MQGLMGLVPRQPRPAGGPFLFSVDHCFTLKGQGTVLTGTALSGSTKASLNGFAAVLAFPGKRTETLER